MDENSCEGETSESAENVLDRQRTKKTDDVSHLENVGVKIKVDGVKTLNQVSERVGFSIDDDSGPSTDNSYLKPEDDVVALVVEEPVKPVAKPVVEPTEETIPEPAGESIAEPITRPTAEPTDETAAEPLQESTTKPLEEPTVEPLEESAAQSEQMVQIVEDVSTTQISASTNEMSSAIQPRVRLAPEVEEYEESRTITVGPPPSYSFVMKQKKKTSKPRLPEAAVPNRPPPPTYSGNRGLCLPREESRFERLCNLPSLSEPLWRSHSQPALCPRCGIIILTTIHSHDSVATHVTALALCLFGCWPCCLLPYCMNICKNTYHHCPICQSFLGAYSPC